MTGDVLSNVDIFAFASTIRLKTDEGDGVRACCYSNFERHEKKLIMKHEQYNRKILIFCVLW